MTRTLILLALPRGARPQPAVLQAVREAIRRVDPTARLTLTRHTRGANLACRVYGDAHVTPATVRGAVVETLCDLATMEATRE